MADMVVLPAIYKTSVKDLGVGGILKLEKLGFTFAPTDPTSSVKINVEFRSINSQKCTKQGGKSPPLLNLTLDHGENYFFQFQDFVQRDRCKDFVSRARDAGKNLSEYQNDSRKRKQRVALKNDIISLSGQSNRVILNLTPEIIQQIFSERPSVCKEYLRCVPSKLSEKDFWTKYARAEYLHSRENAAAEAENAAAAAAAEAAEDETLAVLLKRDDILANEARRKIRRVDPTLVIEADEDGYYKNRDLDSDLYAPHRRSFGQYLNQHSDVVLQGRVVDVESGDTRSLAEALARARDVSDAKTDSHRLYLPRMVEIEDLQGSQNPTFIPLNIKDSRDYFDSQQENALKTDHFEVKTPRPTEPLVFSKVPLKVFESLNSSISSNRASKSGLDSLPKNTMKELKLHWTTMQKLLKLFWSSKHPFSEATKVKNEMSEVYQNLLKMKQTVQPDSRHQVSLLVQPMLQALDSAFAHYDADMKI